MRNIAKSARTPLSACSLGKYRSAGIVELPSSAGRDVLVNLQKRSAGVYFFRCVNEKGDTRFVKLVRP